MVTKKGHTFVPTFASEKAAIFFSASPEGGATEKGSLIYWFLREKKNAESTKSLRLRKFNSIPFNGKRSSQALTIHFNFFTMESLILAQDER